MKRIICVAMTLMLLLALCACDTVKTSQTAKDVKLDLSQIMTEIESSVALPENMDDITNSELLLDYYGINSEDVKSFAVKFNGTGIKCDEIIMIEAADDEALEKISTALNNRLEDVKNQMNNYLPDEYEIASKCKVETVGNYVVLFISPDAQRMTEIFKSKF